MDRSGCWLLLFWAALLLPSVYGLAESPPVWLSEPPSRLTFSNSSGGSAPCRAGGRPTPAVTWQDSASGASVGDAVPGLRRVTADGSLVFLPFPASALRQGLHDGVYRCVARNPLGALVSRDLHVSAVLTAEYHLTSRSPEFVLPGNTAVLRCEVSPPLRDPDTFRFAWTTDDGRFMGPDDISEQYAVLPTGELYIFSVSDSTRRYRCQLRDPAGTAVHADNWTPISLALSRTSTPPAFIHWSTGVRARSGTTVRLGCAASGLPRPEVRWLFRPSSGLPTVSVHRGPVLTLGRAEARHSGTYVCVAANGLGERRVEIALTVNDPLRVRVGPETVRAPAGAPLTLTCNVTGGGPFPRISWLKDAGPLGHVLGPTLRVSALRREDAGIYQCLARSGRLESAQASSHVLVLAESPRLLATFLQSQEVSPGDSVSLSCVATGRPLPRITWSKDGEEPTGARLGDFVTAEGTTLHSFLNISRAGPVDGGRYTCRAQNVLGTAEHRGYLQVPGPPAPRPPRNHTVLAGSTVELACPVVGHPLARHRWEKDGVRLPSSPRQQISADGSLTLHEVSRQGDQGEWACRAYTPDGTLSSRGVIRLAVAAGPVVDRFAFPPALTEGRRASVQCLVSDGDPPVTISWLKDGRRPLPPGVKVETPNQFAASLFFERVSANLHAGNYTCVASNPYHSFNRTAEMVVQVPPRWTLPPPEEASALLGSSAWLDCQAEGSPSPVVRWQKAPADGVFQTIMSNAKTKVLENGTLMIQELRVEDRGTYACQAFNGVGPGLSQTVSLQVKVPAHFERRGGSTQRVPRGETVSLDCEAFGDPPLILTWNKDGAALNFSFPSRLSVRQFPRPDGATGRLTVNAAVREDTGVFSCRAANPHGSDELPYQLLVLEPPGSPGTPEALQVGSRSATVRWGSAEHDGNSPVTGFVLEVRETSCEPPPCAPRPAVSVPPEPRQAVLRGLSPRRRYEVRARAENGQGLGPASSRLLLTTEEEAPNTAPTDISVLPTGPSTLLVKWNYPRQDGGGGVTGFYVGYRPEQTEGHFVFKTLSAGAEAALGGLQPNTTYVVVVQAFNGRGAGPQSDPIRARTLAPDSVPPPSIRLLAATSSSLNVAWDYEGTAEQFAVFVKKQEGGEWSREIVPGSTRKQLLRGLECGSTYLVYVQPLGPTGVAASDLRSYHTQGNVPRPPSRRQLLSGNGTVLLQAWSDGGCPIRSFELRYRPAIGENAEWVPVAVEGTVAQLPTLAPGRRYRLLIRATNAAGSAEAEYDYIPTGRTEVRGGQAEHHRRITVITSSICSTAVLVVIVAAACTVLRQRRQPEYGLSPGATGNDTERRAESSKEEELALGAWEKEPKYGREPIYLPCPYAADRLCGRPGYNTAESSLLHAYDVPIQARTH